jgi:hypothetical protein
MVSPGKVAAVVTVMSGTAITAGLVVAVRGLMETTGTIRDRVQEVSEKTVLSLAPLKNIAVAAAVTAAMQTVVRALVALVVAVQAVSLVRRTPEAAVVAMQRAALVWSSCQS